MSLMEQEYVRSLKPSCVAVFVLRRVAERVECLLLRRTGLYLDGVWQMVTGKVEEGETAWEAALRELKEETGLHAEELYTEGVETFYMFPLDRMYSNPLFVAFVSPEAEVCIDENEHDQFEWLPFDQVKSRLAFMTQKECLRRVEQYYINETPSPHEQIDLKKAYFSLETPRLRLRHFWRSDIEWMSELLADPQVMEYSLSGACDLVKSREIFSWLMSQTEEYGMGLCAVFHKEKKRFIGFCGIFWPKLDGQIETELGFRFSPEYWGQGLAKESAQAVMQYMRDERDTKQLVSMIDPKNSRSIRLAESLGGKVLRETEYKGLPIVVYGYDL
ncbi:MAG: hypothetical protein CMO81_12100 [Waddliaceae bacterium]|nr:hypothetical protein [Waddliaceae bacterium]